MSNLPEGEQLPAILKLNSNKVNPNLDKINRKTTGLKRLDQGTLINLLKYDSKRVNNDNLQHAKNRRRNRKPIMWLNHRVSMNPS